MVFARYDLLVSGAAGLSAGIPVSVSVLATGRWLIGSGSILVGCSSGSCCTDPGWFFGLLSVSGYFLPFPVPAALSGLGLGCFVLSLVVADFFWQMAYRFWLDSGWLLFGLQLYRSWLLSWVDL